MSSINDNLIKIFGNEIWLYLDKSLPEDRINFWEQKLRESEELRKYFDETINSLNYYSKSGSFDLDDSKFSQMINLATGRKSFLQKVGSIIKSKYNRKTLQPYYGKLVLAFTILVTVITAFLLTQNSFRKLNQSNTTLDWNAKAITEQIDEIKNLLTDLENQSNRKSIVNKFLNSEWRYNYFQIQRAINKIEIDVVK